MNSVKIDLENFVVRNLIQETLNSLLFVQLHSIMTVLQFKSIHTLNNTTPSQRMTENLLSQNWSAQCFPTSSSRLIFEYEHMNMSTQMKKLFNLHKKHKERKTLPRTTKASESNCKVEQQSQQQSLMSLHHHHSDSNY